MSQFLGTVEAEPHMLMEAAITAFAFVALIREKAKPAVAANTCDLKDAKPKGLKTKSGKAGAGKLCRIIKTRVISGEELATPATVPPKEIRDLRSLFSAYRLTRKQTTQAKNRIHPLLRENLCGFTREEIFGKAFRGELRALGEDPALGFQINLPLGRLEREEQDIERLKGRALLAAAPFKAQIDILASMCGISVFIAAAIIADIITAERFKNSKAFTAYLRSAPTTESSNASEKNRKNMKGRKLPAAMEGSEKLNRWYNRLCRYKKPGLARAGLRRRAFTELYQMLKKGEYHYGRKISTHSAKMRQYEWLLESHGISFRQKTA